jgi:hypothetical protein
VSAAGNVQPATGQAKEPGLWASSGTGLRLLVGWCSVAVALLNVFAELDRIPDRTYLLFHAMLLAGGLLLIMVGWGAARTEPAGALAGGAVLTAGMLFTALPVNDTVCCMSTFAVRHGYPFSFLARHDGGRWHADIPHLLADLLFWGYAGLIAVLLVALTRRLAEHRDGTRK